MSTQHVHSTFINHSSRQTQRNYKSSSLSKSTYGYIEHILQKHDIPEEDKELYVYGFRQGLFMLINITTTFVLGLVLGMFLHSLLFFVVYTSLRVFAGGAHAKTPLRCFLYSTLLTAVVLSAVKFIPWSFWSGFTVLLAGGAVVFILAPVESVNKPLSSKEIAVYKKRVRFLLPVYTVLSVLLLMREHILFAMTIAVSIGALSFMLVIGKVPKRKIDQNSNC